MKLQVFSPNGFNKAIQTAFLLMVWSRDKGHKRRLTFKCSPRAWISKVLIPLSSSSLGLFRKSIFIVFNLLDLNHSFCIRI